MTYFEFRVSTEAAVYFDVVIAQADDDARAAEEAAIAEGAAMLQKIDELDIGQPTFRLNALPRGACYPTITPQGEIEQMVMEIEDYECRTEEQRAQDLVDDAAEAEAATPTLTVWGFRAEPGLNREDQDNCTWFEDEDECRGEAETFEIVEKCGTEIWKFEHKGPLTAGALAEFMTGGPNFGEHVETLRWQESLDKVVAEPPMDDLGPNESDAPH